MSSMNPKKQEFPVPPPASSRKPRADGTISRGVILNAAALNFVAFEHFVAGGVSGQVFTVFIIILAASEAAIALAIVLQVYRGFRSILSTSPKCCSSCMIISRGYSSI